MKDFNKMSPHAGVEVNIMPVIGDSSLLKLDESELGETLPILALRNAVIFPGTVFPVTIGRESPSGSSAMWRRRTVSWGLFRRRT